uniref:PNPLA domain-containing protein n=1 Tax=Steinernema glaseri TaxID=37863 RepID=A0A1I8A984_9BILA
MYRGGDTQTDLRFHILLEVFLPCTISYESGLRVELNFVPCEECHLLVHSVDTLLQWMLLATNAATTPQTCLSLFGVLPKSESGDQLVFLQPALRAYHMPFRLNSGGCKRRAPRPPGIPGPCPFFIRLKALLPCSLCVIICLVCYMYCADGWAVSLDRAASLSVVLSFPIYDRLLAILHIFYCCLNRTLATGGLSSILIAKSSPSPLGKECAEGGSRNEEFVNQSRPSTRDVCVSRAQQKCFCREQTLSPASRTQLDDKRGRTALIAAADRSLPRLVEASAVAGRDRCTQRLRALRVSSCKLTTVNAISTPISHTSSYRVFLSLSVIHWFPASGGWRYPEMPSSRCAHTLSQNKKVERISNLVEFIKTANHTQVSTKLADVWAHPQSSITDARFLLVFGANPNKLYENDYGEKTLSERVESGSLCEMCAPKFQSFLDNSLKIYDCQFNQTPIHIPKKNLAPESSGFVTLSLDGGGMRGLVSVMCMMFASRRLFGDESLPTYMDWFVGTSTGSMLALALAKGYSLRETFFLYWEMKTKIFLDTGTLSRLFSNAVDKQTVMLEEVLGDCFCDEDQFTSCPQRVTVPALDVSTTPAKLHVFRNYPLRSDDEPVEEISFRDAARASSAAPTYFHPHTLNGRKLVDGSLVANCPLSVLFSEHDRRMKHGLKEKFACIISIGTGEPKHTERKYKSGSNFRQRSKHLLHLGELMFEQVNTLAFMSRRDSYSTIWGKYAFLSWVVE